MRIDSFNSDQYLNKAYNIPSQGRTAGIGHDAIQNRQPGQENASPEQDSKVQETKQPVRRANASLGNVAISLGNKDSSLVGLGGLGGIQSNVMKDAVSQMKRDSILHEYQYFVGSGVNNINSAASNTESAIINNDEDGVIIRKS